MPDRHHAYLAIVRTMVKLGADDSQMFGMPTLKFERKAFCGLWGQAMVFKLAGADHAAALKIKGAHLFDPSDMGRPMKAWVVIPRSGSAKWKIFAHAAFAAMVGATTKG